MKPLPVMLAPALALAACGGGADAGKGERSGGGAPFGFELAAAAAAAAEAGSATVRELAPEEVPQALASGSIRLIDIRTDAEVADGGTIPGAEHIPMDRIKPELLDNGDGREVVLYCRSGARSLATATRLAEESGKPVTHMPGGILAWRERARLAACKASGSQDC